jgi:phage-related protein
MTARHAVTMTIVCGLVFLVPVAIWAQAANPKPPHNPPKNAAKNAAPPRKNPPPPAGAGRQTGGQTPGAQTLQRLSRMKPAEREKALANLPPDRRQQVLKRLQDYESLTPEARARATAQLNRLNSLPPQKQNQVRRSLQQLQQLPEERKASVGAELDRLGAMSPDERTERMKSEEFQSKYSPEERRMMGNISQVLPEGK